MKKRIFSRMISFAMMLVMLVGMVPVIGASALSEQGVGMGSEVLTDAKVGDKIRYTATFSAQRLFENFQATLTYDADCLELVPLYGDDGEELTDMYDIGSAMCPNLYSPFVNATGEGVVRLFDINLDGNDFSEEKVLLTMEFIVKDTAYSEINLTIDEMTILGGEEDYFTGGEAVITEGVGLAESLEVTERAPEQTKVYTVVFLDYDGKFIEVQMVNEGKSAVAPEAPSRSGYDFSGWDTEFENVTSNIIVKATYTKLPKPPVQTPTTGSLKIEVAGGKGFSISIDGGAFKAQGASYANSQAPIGATVCVKAKEVADATFMGWINPITGIVASSDLDYTFTASGNDFLKAMYAVKVENVQMVTFKNDKANRILDSQYYASADVVTFPNAPTQVGYDFAGWSMTEAEIKSAIANGEDVTVVAKWTKALVPVEVTVVGGTGSGTYYANNQVTVNADYAPQGKKFAYWTDAQGNIRSYSAEYTFFPAKDTTVTAVFVDADAEIDYQILVSLDSIDTTTVEGKNVFTYSWYCPDSYSFVKAGIVAVNKDNYNEATFVAGSSDSNVYDRSPNSANNVPVNTYTWSKSGVTSGQTWRARAYVQYRDANGDLQTVYSDIAEATKD
ncbi:MAG: InlB B-repeat-containing protein [Ruminococcus sp.]|nr:InlB B-repeat-containing protein [Ruminococcus sp.]